MPLAVIALFFAAFCVGTTEFVVAGLLPEVSRDLSVSIAQAGYLISAYAVAVAIGGPLVTLAISRFGGKTGLLMLMGVFIAGHVICALAEYFGILMGGRIVVALSHGSFFGIAGVVAVSVVAPEKRGAALGLLFAGVSVANILGVPGGTAIGTAFGWRSTFWVVGGLALLAAVLLMLTVPNDTRSAADRPGLRAQFEAMLNQKVLFGYLYFFFFLTGFWALFTFVAPFLLDITQVSADLVPLWLLLFGLGGTAGTVLGGRLADRIPEQTLIFAPVFQSVVYALIFLFAEQVYLMGALLFVMGVAGFACVPTLSNRVLTGAARAPELASTVMGSAANFGIALGAFVGSQVLLFGGSYQQLPAFAAVIAATALVSVRLERRQMAAAE